MGCHTWYRVPSTIGKEAVRDKMLATIDKWRNSAPWWSDEAELQAKNDTQDLMDFNFESEAWYNWNENESFRIVNGIPALYKNYEGDSDEPRIGGYPETIITSAEQMFEFMKTGYYREDDSRHFNFHIPEDRKDRIYNLITTFFEKHPDGIITFG